MSHNATDATATATEQPLAVREGSASGNAWRLQQAISALHGGVRSLREEDADLSFDINESLPDETAAVEAAVLAVLRSARQADAYADLAGGMAQDNLDRKARFKARADRLRGIAVAAMMALETRKIEAPDLTASVAAGRTSLQITDEKTVPDQYWRVKRELDRTLITEELKAGVVIDGAELSPGLPYITIRSR